jgi:hypothetical protein
MKRLKKIVVFVILAILVAIATVPRAWWQWVGLLARPEITEEAYGRIRPGMTLQEVEAIIGAAPGHYPANSSMAPIWRGYTAHAVYVFLEDGQTPESWGMPHASISLIFDEQGKVVRTDYHSFPVD